jgi:hypothetical protein
VVFESGWLHFADRVSAYRQVPDAVQQWLRQIPVAWDETRLLGGYPGNWVAVARRKGQTWYLGGINGQDQPLTVDLPLGLLPPGPHKATRIGDRDAGRGFAHQDIELSPERPLTVSMRPRGGFVVSVFTRSP